MLRYEKSILSIDACGDGVKQRLNPVVVYFEGERGGCAPLSRGFEETARAFGA